MEPVDDVRNRLLLLLSRRDPGRVLFRLSNVDAPNDGSRFGVNVKPATGNLNEFPRLTVEVGSEANDLFASDDATIDAYEGAGTVEDTGEVDAEGRPIIRTNDPEFAHAQEYICTVVHEGENASRNLRTDRNVAAAWVAGGPKLADPSAPGSALDYVVSWKYAATRHKQWDAATIRAVTIFTVTVNMIRTRSEILSVALPDATRKGEV